MNTKYATVRLRLVLLAALALAHGVRFLGAHAYPVPSKQLQVAPLVESRDAPAVLVYRRAEGDGSNANANTDANTNAVNPAPPPPAADTTTDKPRVRFAPDLPRPSRDGQVAPAGGQPVGTLGATRPVATRKGSVGLPTTAGAARPVLPYHAGSVPVTALPLGGGAPAFRSGASATATNTATNTNTNTAARTPPARSQSDGGGGGSSGSVRAPSGGKLITGLRAFGAGASDPANAASRARYGSLARPTTFSTTTSGSSGSGSGGSTTLGVQPQGGRSGETREGAGEQQQDQQQERQAGDGK